MEAGAGRRVGTDRSQSARPVSVRLIATGDERSHRELQGRAVCRDSGNVLVGRQGLGCGQKSGRCARAWLPRPARVREWGLGEGEALPY
eukprot:2456876-Prymnesium_polylepis.1